MINKIYPNIYRQEITLPNNPLKALNSYIITSKNKNLIIDTGFNRRECKEVFMENIKKLNIDLSKTELFITHLHSDHSGLAAELSKEVQKVYASRYDGKVINNMTSWEYWYRLEDFKKVFDLGKDDVSLKDHPGYKFSSKEIINFHEVKQGDIINIGEYSFEVTEIPGHTPDQVGLYEKEHKLLFCGDHILDRITPNIAFWTYEKDMLSIYFESLKKIYEYDIEKIFTAHRGQVKDYRQRIKELFKHHEKRLNEVRSIIKNCKHSVRDTASKMDWELRYDNWKEFPNAQKWFATEEAMSHLEYLFFNGEASKTMEDGILYYKLEG
ncbi:MBL fold metallo-hydrolase [Clostridium tetani]|uniref:MBL fold metallo-hydrolase n=1 Tax=Clostridium tetani TaxID=1513 RepID=A0ABY0ERM4_CLOTA|nr:MBL fold metallo-hydrolase [Clostridium tetani]KHO39753.1 Zn-dependent hydrolase [Clostridium tetani]RXI38412.1 MBL fold metallo-hydrolase [Clostridium tetani]RXI54171.1 MBL fold metallo-hydrolase [Clostridium tetani]RXI68833.1 MBL fold metallo-hydrolase [Clostridium tetani]